jgi:hypothetical protein
MAENKVTTNDEGGKGTEEIRFGHSREAINEREKMAAELDAKIFDPLGLLAGLLAGVKPEEGKDSPDAYEALNSVGYLLGLVVHGIRKEVSFQVYGLDKDALMGMILQKGFEQDLFGKEGAA